MKATTALEQGLAELRLQQQDAAAQLQQINNYIQQQIGAISGAQRLAQAMQARSAARKHAAQTETPSTEEIIGGDA